MDGSPCSSLTGPITRGNEMVWALRSYPRQQYGDLQEGNIL